MNCIFIWTLFPTNRCWSTFIWFFYFFFFLSQYVRCKSFSGNVFLFALSIVVRLLIVRPQTLSILEETIGQTNKMKEIKTKKKERYVCVNDALTSNILSTWNDKIKEILAKLVSWYSIQYTPLMIHEKTIFCSFISTCFFS